MPPRLPWFAVALSLACGESVAPNVLPGDSSSTGDDAWTCVPADGEDEVVLPGCDPTVLPAGAAAFGSGATWCIETDSGSSITIDDGPVRLNLAFEPFMCLPSTIGVHSLASPTPPELFALGPIYEIRVSEDCPGVELQPEILLPEDTVAACGSSRTLVSLGGGGFSDLVSPIYTWPGAVVQVVATRPCPELPICTGACTDTAHDETSCGACGAACDALCQASNCIGEGFEGEPPGVFIGDGSAVYWAVTEAEPPRRIRRMSFPTGTAVLDDLVADVDVLVLDAAPGVVAWVERTATETRLRRRDDDGEQVVPLSISDASRFPLRITPDATVLAPATHDPPIVLIPSASDVVVPLPGCFASAAYPGRAFAIGIDGPDVLVLGEDEDPDDMPGDLWRCATDGSTVAELVDDVHWVEPPVGEAWKVFADGGKVHLVGGGSFTVSAGSTSVGPGEWPYPYSTVFVGTTAYWGSGGAIFRQDGGATEELFTGVAAWDLAIASDRVVFRDGEHDERIVVLELP